MLAFLVLMFAALAADYRTPAGMRPASAQVEAPVLPGGRLLTPAGRLYATGPGPFGLAISPGGDVVVSADGGPNRYGLTVLRRDGSDWRSQAYRAKRRGDADDDEEDGWRSIFMGLAFDDANTLYASEGNSGHVRVVDVRTGKKIRDYSLAKDAYTGDVAFDVERGLLYVVDQARFSLAIVDTRKHRVVSTIRIGRIPFAIALSPDRQRVYVTHLGMFEYKLLSEPVPFPLFGFPSPEAERALGKPDVAESNSLAVVDVTDSAQPKVVTMIPTGTPYGKNTAGGSSPSGVAATADAIYVSNAHNDTITVVNARTLKVEREIPIRIPGLELLRGVMPIGITHHAPSNTLLVAEAGINAVGVIDPRAGRVVGHIPSCWFPTRVAVRDTNAYVSCAKGVGTGPNANRADTFQADFRRGAVNMFPLPEPAGIAQLTSRVYANNGFTPSNAAPSTLPPEIKHVVIIVKENRTYDEVFGANARYGPPVTPNHQELASRYASSDNFYADSEVSVDGHHWLAGAYPNAWTESTLMASYGGQKDFRKNPEAPGRLLFAESGSSVHPEEQNEAGTLWHHLERHRVSFRNFGEGFELAGIDEGEGLKPTGGRFPTNMPMPDPLFRNTSRTYPGYNMNIPDQYRATQFISEMSGAPKLPQFIFIHLPNDHTAKPRPQDGYPTAAAYVADNDYALGRVLEFLSRRPEWKQMAVFITEDDAQGGVDPVDSHRTVLLIASPYAKPGYVSHRNTSFPGLLKTAFRLLRIPPLNLYDAAAADLSDCFQATPNALTYETKAMAKKIFDPALAREPKDPKPSARMDDPRELRRQHKPR